MAKYDYETGPIRSALKLLEATQGKNVTTALFRLALLPEGSVSFCTEDAELMFGPDFDAKRALQALCTSSVVTKLSDNTYEIHDLCLKYLQSEAAQLHFLHRLLDVATLRLELVSSFFNKLDSHKFYTPYIQKRLKSLLDAIDVPSLPTKFMSQFEDPDLPKRLHVMGWELCQTARYSEAEPLLMAAVFTARLRQSDISSWRRLQLWLRKLLRKVTRSKNANAAEVPPFTLYLNSLARCLVEMGHHAKAEAFYIECKAILRVFLGKKHAAYAETLDNLAQSLGAQGNCEEAEALTRECLQIMRKVHGCEHPLVAGALNKLVHLLCDQGKLDEAEPMMRELVRLDEKILGKGHASYAMDLSDLAELLISQEKHSEAEPLYRQALAIDRNVYGNKHPDVAVDLANLGEVLRALGRLDEAETAMREALAIFKKVLGEEHPNVAILLNKTAVLLSSMGKYSDAKAMYDESLAIRRKHGGKSILTSPKVSTTSQFFWKLDNETKEAARLGNAMCKDHPKT